MKKEHWIINRALWVKLGKLAKKQLTKPGQVLYTNPNTNTAKSKRYMELLCKSLEITPAESIYIENPKNDEIRVLSRSCNFYHGDCVSILTNC
jgi:hypothetical protein